MRQPKRIALVIEYDDGSVESIGSNEIERAMGGARLLTSGPEQDISALSGFVPAFGGVRGFEINLRVEGASDYEAATWTRLDRWPL